MSDRRFEIGDEVVALEAIGPLRQDGTQRIQPGAKGKLYNVIYGDGGKNCCLSINRCPEDHLKLVVVHWDCGARMGIKFHWSFGSIKVIRRPTTKQVR
jgi:hypothetical protein